MIGARFAVLLATIGLPGGGDGPTEPSPLTLVVEKTTWNLGLFAFNPDSTRVAQARDDGRVVLFDTTTGVPDGPPLEGGFKTSAFTGSFSLSGVGSIRGLDFAPGGRTLFFAQGNKLAVWDVATRALILRRERTAGCCLVPSPDGRLLAFDSDDTVVVWDVSRREEAGPPQRGRVGGFRPDSRVLAILQGRRVVLWDIDERAALASMEHEQDVRKVLFSPDGRLLAVISRASRVSNKGPVVSLWEVAERRLRLPPVALEKATFSEGGDDPSIAFSSDGRFVTAGNWKSNTLWDLASGSEPRSVAASGNPRAFAREGALLVVGDSLWNVAPGTPELVHQCDGLDLSADGRTIACRSHQEFTLWDVSSRTVVGRPVSLKGVKEWTGPVFSPDGRRIAVMGRVKGQALLTVWSVAGLREDHPPASLPTSDQSSSPSTNQASRSRSRKMR